MREMILKRCLWLSAALTLLAVAMGVAGPKRDRDLPYRYDSPLIALQMAEDRQQVEKVVDPKDSGRRAGFRNHLLLDVVFLGAYGALFLHLGWALTLRPQRMARMFGRLAMVGAVLSAALDLGENWLMWNAINGGSFDALRTVALAKWAAVGATAFFIAPLFLPRLPLDGAIKLYAGVALFFFLLASATLIGGVWEARRHYPLEHAATPLGFAILAQAFCFSTRRKREEFAAHQLDD